MQRKPLVLIVDDVLENIEVLGGTLASTCDIQFATSGPECLNLVRDNLPDLILLDVMMPEMDGFEVCQILKNRSVTRDVPIIFVTAKTDAESEIKALAAGAVDFIHKPILSEVVRARVNAHLKLRARELELKQLNADLEGRVNDKTEVLRHALLQAESAHKAKSAFLSNMSHELRTPLNAILGLTGILIRKSGDEWQRQKLNDIHGAGERLLGLVISILEISKLEAGRFEVDSVDFDIKSLLDLSAGTLQKLALTKGLLTAQEIDPALPEVLHGAYSCLSHVLKNLVSNAIKFSDTGTVTLRAFLLSNAGNQLNVRFEVEDQGVGITEEQQRRIFDIFEQADNSTTRKYGGAGLGLAICKHLVLLMKGRIGVNSNQAGGSTFWVSVPLAEAENSRVSLAEGLSRQYGSEWNQARKLFRELEELLMQDSIDAQLLWMNSVAQFGHLLAERSIEFNEAIENFDFTLALNILRNVFAKYPQLSER